MAETLLDLMCFAIKYALLRNVGFNYIIRQPFQYDFSVFFDFGELEIGSLDETIKARVL